MSSRVKDSGTPTTIGGDLTIAGNVASKGEIQLDGHVQGDIHCVALILGESANVEGNVTADDVVIRGRLMGSVRALRVMLQATAHVEGDLIQQKLVVEQGAHFEGRSRHSEDLLSVSQTTEDLATPKPETVVDGSKRKEKQRRPSCDPYPEAD